MEHAEKPSAANAREAHRPLVDPIERESLGLTGFALTVGGERHEYRLSAGTWRCVTAFAAVGQPRHITDLTRALEDTGRDVKEGGI